MTYYLKKRIQSGIERSDMANMLGIEYQKYVDIERGERKMPTNLIDKFNEIIKKGKTEIQLDHLNKEQEVNAWIEEMKQPSGDGIMLQTKMKEFNIKTYTDLGRLLGYTNGSIIGTCMNSTREVGYTFKNRLYDFFQDELNIQKAKAKKIANKERKKASNLPKEYVDFYNNFDLQEWLYSHKMRVADFSKKTGVACNTIYNYINNKGAVAMPSATTIGLIKNYIENTTTPKIEPVTYFEEPIKQNKTEYVSKVTLIAECQKEIDENNAKIQELQKQIDEIKSKNALTAKFVDFIQALE